mmetsp:Transcript_26379/g.53439  ORF Transcript_26379/g.53439 Transcript_26379/m.53439 type:complete len:213 (+) Transcript_26379:271-909(+)
MPSGYCIMTTPRPLPAVAPGYSGWWCPASGIGRPCAIWSQFGPVYCSFPTMRDAFSALLNASFATALVYAESETSLACSSTSTTSWIEKPPPSGSVAVRCAQNSAIPCRMGQPTSDSQPLSPVACQYCQKAKLTSPPMWISLGPFRHGQTSSPVRADSQGNLSPARCHSLARASAASRRSARYCREDAASAGWNIRRFGHMNCSTSQKVWPL